VIRPLEEDQDSQWEGAVSSIKNRIDKMKNNLMQQNKKILRVVEDKNHVTKKLIQQN
jgi:hypothetical protein